MGEPRFRSDIVVKAVASCGTDKLIAEAAWVLDPSAPPPDDKDGSDAHARVIGAMLRGRHGTPFEHGLMAVYVEAPVVVWWEWTRHRFMSLGCPDLGFNLESGRYKVLDGEFYLPPEGRPIYEPRDFKPMRPQLLTAEESWQEDSRNYADSTFLFNSDVAYLRANAIDSWRRYEKMIDKGVAREVARLALGFNIYYAGYVSANPRSWLQFFSLRRRDERAIYATFPQWEIEQADKACESIFAVHWPITYHLFNKHGRVAP